MGHVDQQRRAERTSDKFLWRASARRSPMSISGFYVADVAALCLLLPKPPWSLYQSVHEASLSVVVRALRPPSMYSPLFARTLRCFVTIANEKRVLKDARTTARVIQTALICPYGPLDLSSTPKTGSEMEGFIMKRGGPPLTPPSPRLARLALSNKCLARSDRSRPNSTG